MDHVVNLDITDCDIKQKTPHGAGPKLEIILSPRIVVESTKLEVRNAWDAGDSYALTKNFSEKDCVKTGRSW